MPLIYVLVAMIVLLGGYYAGEVRQEEDRIHLESQASAVAGNMIAFRGLISDVATFRNEEDQLVNYDRYYTYTGSAQAFLDATPEENRPDTKLWFTPIDGVKGWIENGQLYIYYDPPDNGISPPQAGVQSALLRITQNSTRVGYVQKN